MKNLFAEVAVLFSYLRNLVLLAGRILLAYGFTMPALHKLNNLPATSKWFESSSIPLPTMASYLVSGIETMGIVLLLLGLYTRYISFLLACVMIGAIFFIHFPHGFSASNNGIEIPLYYLLFLMFFMSYGAGKYSLDNALFKDGIDE